MDMSLGELWELVMDREAWRGEVHGFTKNRTWLSNWTELIVGHFTKGSVYDKIVSQPFLPDFFFFSFSDVKALLS